VLHRLHDISRRVVKILLIRSCPPETPKAIVMIATAAIVAGAGLVAATATIHLHLWLAGYRHVSSVGPLFLAQAISGLLLAPRLGSSEIHRHAACVQL
jgi:hypothetical protein